MADWQTLERHGILLNLVPCFNFEIKDVHSVTYTDVYIADIHDGELRCPRYEAVSASLVAMVALPIVKI